MSESVTYTSGLTGKSITFGTSSTILLKGVMGGGMAPMDHFAVDTAYTPGAVFVRTKKKTQVVKVTLAVFGNPQSTNPRADLFQTIDSILAVMEPDISTPGSLTRVGADGVSRTLSSVQYVGGAEIDDQAQNTAYVTIELTFEAYDPTWRSASVHNISLGAATDPFGFSVPLTVPLTIFGQATGVQTMTNSGNIQAKPVFTFTGPCQNFSITSGVTGENFLITQVLAAGDQLIVDSNAGSVTYTPSGGAPVPLYSAFAGGQTFVPLYPGGNTLTFRRDLAGNNQCVVTYQDAWNHG